MASHPAFETPACYVGWADRSLGPRDLPVTTSPVLGLQMWATVVLTFSVSLGDLMTDVIKSPNSGPHACVADIVLTEPSSRFNVKYV